MKPDGLQSAHFPPYLIGFHSIRQCECSRTQPAQNGSAANCISRNGSFAPSIQPLDRLRLIPNSCRYSLKITTQVNTDLAIEER
tara:strand:+ start:10508 stop:10759 length:252 start_codon:yes stop_codon:yes gene_type:complete